MITVTLIDETSFPRTTSSLLLDSATVLNIFAFNLDELPKFAKVGDVLRAHRVTVQKWKEGIQLLSASKAKSSFVTFREREQDHEETIPASTEWEISSTAKNNYTFTLKDYERFLELWSWGQRQLSLKPFNYAGITTAAATITSSQQITVSISSLDITPNSSELNVINGDLIAMVTAILPIPPGASSNSPKGCLRLWDGTGPSLSDP